MIFFIHKYSLVYLTKFVNYIIHTSLFIIYSNKVDDRFLHSLIIVDHVIM